VQGVGFRVQGVGFTVQGVRFRVQGVGFRVQGVGFRVQGVGFRRFRGVGLMVRACATTRWYRHLLRGCHGDCFCR
jgi:hypothetical protein